MQSALYALKRNLNIALAALPWTLVTGIAFPLKTDAQRAPNIARSLSAAAGAEGRLLWVDATANVFRKVKINGKEERIPYASTREGVQDIVRRSKAAHINTLVIDVKPLVGYVVFPSKIAPRLRKWQGKEIPDFDILQAFVEEGHKAGLRIHASLNILSEGHKYYSEGLAYQHPDWQTVVYSINRGIRAPNGERLSFRVQGEPDDPAKPLLLTDDTTPLGEAGLKRIGLDSPEDADANAVATVPFGERIYIPIDSANRAEGVLDAALLGDDPLFAPEDGRMISLTKPADKAWAYANVPPGGTLGFEFRTELRPIAQAQSEKVACFVNPLHPEARKHQIDLIKEILNQYEVDGIVLDRCRYSNIYNDFSDLTRQAFTRWLGKPISRWPEDVFSFSSKPGKKTVPGPYYKQWLEFRAQTIRDLVAEIARTVRGMKPNITLGTYVGAWYPTYYEVGVNWGSEKTHLRYSWFTEDYPRTAYAEFFDWIALGSYHPYPRKEDARRAGKSPNGSVEGLTELGNIAIANGAFTYGGVYVIDYKNRPEDLKNALEAASRQGQGWMIFDLTYIQEYDFWSIVESASKNDAPAPDSLKNLLPVVRQAMDIVR